MDEDSLFIFYTTELLIHFQINPNHLILPKKKHWTMNTFYGSIQMATRIEFGVFISSHKDREFLWIGNEKKRSKYVCIFFVKQFHELRFSMPIGIKRLNLKIFGSCKFMVKKCILRKLLLLYEIWLTRISAC